ncbi:uncharacterized protein LOC108673429 [Hyalella azteca]|uniref:Uncharacterized protein LOC108673429 n=1 Tax=Hyalella azteca TaxID=294128 RepID=A0A8B7NUV9_HYAAZ|nr:uncharacterized protein LOC108673429 [Hyalella azteca]
MEYNAREPASRTSEYGFRESAWAAEDERDCRTCDILLVILLFSLVGTIGLGLIFYIFGTFADMNEMARFRLSFMMNCVLIIIGIQFMFSIVGLIILLLARILKRDQKQKFRSENIRHTLPRVATTSTLCSECQCTQTHEVRNFPKISQIDLEATARSPDIRIVYLKEDCTQTASEPDDELPELATVDTELAVNSSAPEEIVPSELV